jgi:hypothetical protein
MITTDTNTIANVHSWETSTALSLEKKDIECLLLLDLKTILLGNRDTGGASTGLTKTTICTIDDGHGGIGFG